jgi:hypothetical protein
MGPQAREAAREAPAARFSAAVYGSFLVASVVAVSYAAGEDARRMTETLSATMLVFWLAHAWSEVVGHHIASGRRVTARDVMAIAGHEWPLVEAAVVPTIFLVLAWTGVWPRETGAALAFGSAVVQVTAWGILAALRSGGSVLSAVLHGAVQGMLALALVALKGLID